MDTISTENEQTHYMQQYDWISQKPEQKIRTQTTPYCVILSYKVHKEATIIFCVRRQSSGYLWAGGTESNEEVLEGVSEILVTF